MEAIYCNRCNSYVETADGTCPNCSKNDSKEINDSLNIQRDKPPLFLGWMCPRCQKIWSPDIAYCHDCLPKKSDKDNKILLEEQK